jgi:plasmid stabilization system protein ParE
MAIVFRAPRAQTDIDDIAFRIGLDNPTASLRWLAELNGKLILLADFPGIGPMRDELERAYRSYPFGNYLILYREISGGIEVSRVIDGRRDLPVFFGSGKPSGNPE